MEPFKNIFNFDSLKKMAKTFKLAYPDFNAKRFLLGIEASLEPLEMKARVHLIKDRLILALPKSATQSFPILIASLKSPSNPSGLSGFLVWPLTQFVEDQGLSDFSLSMTALKEMTKVFTSEFAVRSFLKLHQQQTLKLFAKWTNDPNPHVRRLVSEGARPRLPWGAHLPDFAKNPKLTWSLLEALHLDNSEYVRKSVANHINDHSKNHPDFVLRNLRRWKKQNPNSPDLDRLVRHATRSLIKLGNSQAFALHGIVASEVKVAKIKVKTLRIRLGSQFRAMVELHNQGKKPAEVILDHSFEFLKANGKHGKKIFKGRRLKILAGEKKVLELSVPLVAVTTRTYYPGRQYWSLQLNGKPQERFAFSLSI